MERLNHNTSHLRCDELSDGMVAQKIAYLLRVNRRVDRNGYPYLVFAFKTADKVVLTGRKFKIMENDSIGVQILALNRTVVEVDFEVQIYNGTYSLIVRNIIPASKQEISCFFDSYLYADEVFENLNLEALKLSAPTLSVAFKTASVFRIHAGLAGGYLELLDIVYHMISTRKSKHTTELLVCFFNVVNPYFTYLSLIERLEFLPKREILEILHSVLVDNNDRLTSIVLDTLSALMNLGKPEHLYSHIIYNAFVFAEKQLHFEAIVSSQPKDSVSNINNDFLTYY